MFMMIRRGILAQDTSMQKVWIMGVHCQSYLPKKTKFMLPPGTPGNISTISLHLEYSNILGI